MDEIRIAPDMRFSRIGLGTWALGGGGWKLGWGPQDDRVSIAAIRRAVERGVTWIDTAPLYGFGHAEEVVRRALKGIGVPVCVATKCGLVWDAKRHVTHDLSAASIRREVEDSLRRLGRETIDLYQIHWPQPDAMLEEAWSALAALAAAGKIRAAGICNSTPQQIERLGHGLPVATLQVPASMVSPHAVDAAGAWCAERKIACIAYGILEKGLLAGGFTHERVARLPMDDHRKRDPAFAAGRFTAVREFVDAVAPVARSSGMTCAQLAVSWALHDPRLPLVLVGARNTAQVDELLDGAEISLPPAARDAIAASRSRGKLDGGVQKK